MIGTTHFGCGCTVHTELDVNGITPWLEHCARHAAAPALLAALEALRESIKRGVTTRRFDDACAQADAALAQAKGNVTHAAR